MGAQPGKTDRPTSASGGADVGKALRHANVSRGVHGDVVDLLGVDIVGGRWRPGESMPTEAEFMLQLGVSRTVVREALRVLRAKGLVETRTMTGSKVLPRSNWRLLDPDVLQWRINSDDRHGLLRELQQLRLIFEPGAARQATERADDKTRRAVRDAWEALADAAGNRRDFIDADVSFHSVLLAAAGSEMLAQLFAIIEAAQRLALDLQLRAFGEVPFRKEMLRRSLELHRRIVESFMAGDAEGAEADMRAVVMGAIADADKGLRMIARQSESRDHG